MRRRPLDPVRELLRRYPGEWYYLWTTQNPTGGTALQRNLRALGDENYIASVHKRPDGYGLYAMYARVTER